MNLFRLVATVDMDTSEYDRRTDHVVDKGHKMAGKLGSAIKGAAKVAAAGITAATTAVGAFATMATKSFAEYEQLAGGVETLFKDSATKVKGYAAMAYKTAGMSGNEYMETVTSFSASLIQSLGGDTEAAADVANQAIIDMSDNANKMGTDISMIQNAYQGFAKQNYTMLDNLKLGYGGTKTEMQRLIADANKVKAANGEMADLSIESFADVTEAIHIMQDEMGIAGATADEAATTIEGSINSAKGAFKNFVTGFGREDANMVQLTNDLVDAVGTAAKNIIPRVEKVLESLKDVGIRMAPKIAEGISQAVKKAPEFLQAGVDIIGTLAGSLLDQADTLLDSAFELLNTLLDGLNAHPDSVFSAIETLVNTLAENIKKNGPTFFEKAAELISGLGDSLVEHAPEIVIGAVEIMAELAAGLADNLPTVLNKIPGWINDLVNGFTDPENLERLGEAGARLGKAVVKGISDFILPAFGGLTEWFGKLTNDPDAAWKDFKIGVGGFFANPLGTTAGWLTGDSPVEYTPTPIPGKPSTGWRPRRRVDGSNKNGLDYVPFDGYISELHKGERVLTAEENQQYTAGSTYYTTIHVDGYNRDPEELAEALQGLIDRRAAANA